MVFFLRVIYESIVQAVQQLSGNKLRSLLSSLGITIGIFCIISVLSAVDSLERTILASFDKLGTDIVYVDRMSWGEDPGQNWWKFYRRPYPSLSDLEAIQEKVRTADHAYLQVFMPGKTLKYKSSSIGGPFMTGITEEYLDVSPLSFADGRYFTHFEFETGSNKVILGPDLVKELFPSSSGVGKEVKIGGVKYQVIGVLEEEGESLINIIPFDQVVIMPMNTARKLINLSAKSSWQTLLGIKAVEGVPLSELKDEVTGVLRSHRSIRPSQEADFVVNESTFFTNILDAFFAVLNTVGISIGLFAILVGMFIVANIMFVSVTERTNIIGIKKALGAKRSVILLEFLVESVILCLIGGIFGLLFVMGVLKLLSGVFGYDMYVSAFNIILALVMALVIGIVSGFIPAAQAAGMDPVEAMRSK